MLTIAILNSMPESAVRSTERQFSELLTEAALDVPVDVKWFSLYPREGYRSAVDLWTRRDIDGLIATGTEPRAKRLNDEPYWAAFAKTVDWASAHTKSTIWSCLGAHAAVLHLDTVERQAFFAKLHGIFSAGRYEQHPLLADTDRAWHMPHSRWNTLPLHVLHAKGYQILTYGAEVGADLFVKCCHKSLFVFLQGHPEYDGRALLREYRRDILRFHQGERTDYPALPARYFDLVTETRLRSLEVRALTNRNPDIGMQAFQGIIGKARLEATWRVTAVQVYRNWFRLLSTQPALEAA